MLINLLLTSVLFLFNITLRSVLAVPTSQVYELNPPVTDRVFFFIEYYDVDLKQYTTTEIDIELYGTLAPKTVANFVALSKGVRALMPNEKDEAKAFEVGYKNTVFHRIIKDFVIQGGNVLPHIGPFSIYGMKFDDETFHLKHDRPGRLAMANSGPNTNAGQFYFAMKPLPDLDGKHVVFGQVTRGLDILLDKVQFLETENVDEMELKKVKIVNCKVDSLKIENKDFMQNKYMERVQKFRDGKDIKGNSVHFDPYNEGSLRSYNDLHTEKIIKANNNHHNGLSVSGTGNSNIGNIFSKLLGISILVSLGYYLYSKKNNKVVSLRHD
ncbi:uncharacterized protein SCODWIG_00591 [Saccharomycodes ludwigii]|uniref:peptidylprolyl isomerase n=1 Tax=Saccharomycodes ludwigii TaxID=36035 RepID=A0A376B3Y4_9ASCO|nr:hypothetical protein SCDLUD_003736 [Saccharomycodes ludwigii]KAH3900731.1 hypothetical protein SCDLUD_003736 [Saccharomycodes ludwigii]SSD58830.1 uncharacterized protein SCODWIG_00591 [Saccharomycodes ludwigii]